MGKMYFESWCYNGRAEAVKLGSDLRVEDSWNYGTVQPRFDFTFAHIGTGMMLMAGGCAVHPNRCQIPHDFFNTAALYDALADEWINVPNMPTRRHGSIGARVGQKVYALGGQYPEDYLETFPGERFCDIFDIDTRSWQVQPTQNQGSRFRDYQRLMRGAAVNSDIAIPAWVERGSSAFFAAGALDGRVIAYLNKFTHVFNPAREADSWREVDHHPYIHTGANNGGCCCVHNGELVMVSGRPVENGRRAVALRFTHDASSDQWHEHTSRQLPDLNHARIGGALVSVEGRLYAMGGVDEETGEFHSDAERLDEHLNRWIIAPWFQMPRAIHAQKVLCLPTLAR